MRVCAGRRAGMWTNICMCACACLRVCELVPGTHMFAMLRVVESCPPYTLLAIRTRYLRAPAHTWPSPLYGRPNTTTRAMLHPLVGHLPSSRQSISRFSRAQKHWAVAKDHTVSSKCGCVRQEAGRKEGRKQECWGGNQRAARNR